MPESNPFYNYAADPCKSSPIIIGSRRDIVPVQHWTNPIELRVLNSLNKWDLKYLERYNNNERLNEFIELYFEEDYNNFASKIAYQFVCEFIARSEIEYQTAISTMPTKPKSKKGYYIPVRNKFWESLKTWYETKGMYTEKQLAAINREQTRKKHRYFDRFDVTEAEYDRYIKTGKI